MSGAMQEISGLEALEVQMARNLDAMKERRREVKFAGTLRGRLFMWGGRLFALYCVYRTIMVSSTPFADVAGLTAKVPTSSSQS